MGWPLYWDKNQILDQNWSDETIRNVKLPGGDTHSVRDRYNGEGPLYSSTGWHCPSFAAQEEVKYIVTNGMWIVVFIFFFFEKYSVKFICLLFVIVTETAQGGCSHHMQHMMSIQWAGGLGLVPSAVCWWVSLSQPK